MTDIDGKFCKPRHLVARLDAGRSEAVAVEAAAARIGHGAENPVIGAAAAQMTRQRRADLFARRYRRSPGGAPIVVKRSGPDDKARRAEAALQRVVRHEGLLDGMKFFGAN